MAVVSSSSTLELYHPVKPATVSFRLETPINFEQGFWHLTIKECTGEPFARYSSNSINAGASMAILIILDLFESTTEGKNKPVEP